MKLYVEIEADTNDADYVTKRSEITADWLDEFTPLIEAIKNYKGDYNWPSSEYRDETVKDTYPDIDENLLYEFEDYVPNGEYGVHSIDSIKILKVLEEIELL